MRRSLLLLCLLLIAQTASAGDVEARPLRILFIGNSLTYSNDLPKMVRELGAAEGRAIETTSAAYPNFSLEDHFNDGRALKLLRKAKWDFVILQQGPSAMADSRELLIRDAVRFAKLIRKWGAKPVMLTVWPSMGRARDMDRVIESYRLAAEASDSILAPAGEAWKLSMQQNPAITLYGSDSFHPSEAGSRLAATALYRALIAR